MYRKSEVVLSGTVDEGDSFRSGPDQWNRIALEGDGNTIRAYINDTLIGTYEDGTPITAGRIALGSAYTFTQFDNLTVTKLEGRIPYYAELLDNMETYDLTPERNDKLVYNDLWSHQNGQGMYVYSRSMSTSQGTGATLSYMFTGTGLEILAGTKKTATLRVTVDGVVAAEEAVTQPADDMNMIYSLSGIDYGTHSVTIEVTDGVLSVDLVGVLGRPYEKPPATTTPPSPPAAQQPTPPANHPVQTDPTSSPAPTPAPGGTRSSLKKGAVVTVGNARYQITNIGKKEVSYQRPVKKTMKKISIPDKVNLIIDGKKTAFRVTAIRGNAFAKCKKLKSIYIGKNIRQIGKNALKGIHQKAVITCGKKKLSTYKKLLKKGTGIRRGMRIEAK